MTATSNEYEQDFPFEEIRQESGDYFDHIWQLRDLGYADTQIWTVTVHLSLIHISEPTRPY